jgi:hypothetical protein
MALLFSCFANAQQPSCQGQYFFFIGGGGEPSGASTIFDDSIELAKNKIPAGYEIHYYANGGHSKTEQLLQSSFQAAKVKSTLTPDTYAAALKDIGGVLTADTSPCKLIVYVASHGWPGEGYEKSHSISTNGGHLASLDSLADVLKKASSATQLAIVDTSCYSGRSLNLATEKTCVITAAGEQPAFNSFSEKFFSNLKPGENLEAIFLKTRKQPQASGLPQISTKAGLQISKQEISNLTMFALDDNAGVRSLDDALLSHVEGCSECQGAQGRFQAEVSDLKNLVSRGFLKQSSIKNLVSLLQEYAANQELTEKKLKAHHLDLLARQEKFSADYFDADGKKVGTEETTVTWKDLAHLSYGGTLKAVKDLSAKAVGPVEKSNLKAQISILTQIIEKQKQVLTEYPNLKKDVGIQLTTQRNIQLAAAIQAQERLVYEELYQNLSKTEDKPNACSRFIF